jgi:hypothetical protein
MGKTTFTGPIRAGNILNTSGTTLGQDVRNVGSVVMIQVFPITQAGSATALGTQIVLPANSHVVNIQMLNTVAWDGAATTLSVGISATANELCALTAQPLGLVSMVPGADATRAALWDDTGIVDDRIWVKSANTGAGVGTLTVRYIQAHDLP